MKTSIEKFRERVREEAGPVRSGPLRPDPAPPFRQPVPGKAPGKAQEKSPWPASGAEAGTVLSALFASIRKHPRLSFLMFGMFISLLPYSLVLLGLYLLHLRRKTKRPPR